MHKFLLILSIFLLAGLCSETKAQSVTIGTGSTRTSIFGPCNSTTPDSSYGRYMYLYTSNSFGSLRHGDTISSIEFFKGSNANLAGNVNMRILFQLTDSITLDTPNINWFLESVATDVTEVYNDNPVVATAGNLGFKKFNFNKSDFVYDTTKGLNLIVYVEYHQFNSQAGTINWGTNNKATVSSYLDYQTKYIRGAGSVIPDRTNGSTDYHPQIKINFPRYDKDLEVVKHYSLGKLPVPLGNEDSMKAIIKNVGKKDIDSLLMHVKSRGANNLTDSFWVYDIKKDETRYITFTGLKPINFGLDTVTISVAKDDNSDNNIQASFRLANKNLYSYRNTQSSVAPGGIGFNGNDGDFVAKFYSNTPKKINQVSVNFGVLGRTYQMGLWDANGTNGNPGTLVYMTDTLTSSQAFTVLPVLPAAPVSGDFYVGIRQVGTLNVAFGYQNEAPVRRNTFLFAGPAGDTNWIDFAPGADFKFMIEPRIQEGHDVAAIGIVAPKDTVLVFGSDTIAPVVKILNYGSINQTTPFNTVLEAYYNGNLIYTDTQSDTLSAGLTRDITFIDSLIFVDPGNYQLVAYTNLATDSVVINDTFRKTIVVPKYTEIIVDSVTAPRGTIDFKFRDTLAPKAWVSHQGIRTETMSFTTTFEIFAFSGANLVYTSSRKDTLKPFESKMLTFDSTFYPLSLNNYVVRVIVKPDTLSHKDTFIDGFDVLKELDVSPSFSFDPTINGVYELNVDIIYTSVLVSNSSSRNANGIECKYELFGGTKNRIWRDSTVLSVLAGGSSFVDMPIIYCDVEGDFELRVYTILAGDQYPENDTLIVPFKVQKSNDVSVVKAILPFDGEVVVPSTTPFKPIVQVNNLGLVDQPVNFNTTLRIYRDTTLVYTNRQLNIVKANDSVDFVFDWFKPDVKGFYTMVAYTELDVDQLRINDTLISKFTVGAPYDIVPIKFSMPEPDSVYKQSLITLKPQITFSNFGFLDADTLFDVHFEAYSNGVRFYRNTKQITLLSDQSKQVNFDSTFIPNKPGEIEIYAIADLGKDYKHFNDTLIKRIYTYKEIDVLADSAFVPNGIDSVFVNTENFFPQFIIKNLGIFYLPDNWDIQCIIKDPNGVEVYNEMSTVSDIDFGKRKATIFSKAFTPKVEGYHNITFISMLPTDQDPTNDTLFVNFYAVKKVDASLISIIYPNNGQTILTDASAMIFPTVELGQLTDYPITDSINAILEIYSNGNRVYTDTVKTSLDSQERRNVTFAKGFSRVDKGNYILVAFTDHPLEQVNSNDSVSSTFILDFAVSIKDLKGEKLIAYPNPVKRNELINFEYSGSLDGFKATIYSVDGRLMQKDLLLKENTLALSNELVPAIYFLVLQKGNQLFRTTIQIIE
jgi:hypothetical protein